VGNKNNQLAFLTTNTKNMGTSKNKSARFKHIRFFNFKSRAHENRIPIGNFLIVLEYVKKVSFIFLLIISITCCKKTPSPVPKTFKIISSAEGGGTISPLGTRVVKEGADQTYTFTPSNGNVISSITVGASRQPITNSFTFTGVENDNTINVVFGVTINVTVGANGKATPTMEVVPTGGSLTVTFLPNAGFHTDSLWLDGTFVKVLAGATSYTINNVVSIHTMRVTFSDVLPQHSLDSLKNLLAGSWHYVQYDYRFTGASNWIIAPYVTDCEKARHEVYTADNKYTYFLGGTSCDPSYTPTNIYFNGTWKLNASAKNIFIAGNQYSNATEHTYVTGNYTLEKLTADSLVISYPVSGKDFSYRFHYVHK
jgi:hypothetical protein